MEATSVRVDKWLWAARFFKTRGLAQDAVAGGKVKMNDERVKPAKELKAGDVLIQCGTSHSWDNRSDEVCRVLFVMMGGVRGA